MNAYTAKGGLTGADITGYQAADLLAALANPEGEGHRQGARIKKPAVLIETLRIEGRDELTARDQAVYMYLYAQARHDGMDIAEHTMAVEDVLSHLGITDLQRLWECLDRLARTLVSYSFTRNGRRRGTLPLIAVTLDELSEGTATVTYEIPAAVRRAVLEARSFASLEITAFPRFSNKYSARLYQRLALVAGHSDDYRKPIALSPLTFAQQIGFVAPDATSVHYASLRRDCIDPAMRDIADHVERFRATFTEGPRMAKRGRPLEWIAFTVTPGGKKLKEAKASPMRDLDFRLITPSGDDASWRPSVPVVSRGATVLGLRPYDVAGEWRRLVEAARAGKGFFYGHLSSEDFLEGLALYGADSAFTAWVESRSRVAASEKPQPRLPKAPPPRAIPTRPVPAVEAKVAQVASSPVVTEPHPRDHGADGASEAEIASRPEQFKTYMMDSAQRYLNQLDGWHPNKALGRMKLRPENLWNYFDHEGGMWALMRSEYMPPEMQAAGRSLVPALQLLEISTDEHRRISLRTLCNAIIDWDAAKIRRTAAAIIRGGIQTPDGKPAPMPVEEPSASGDALDPELLELINAYDEWPD